MPEYNFPILLQHPEHGRTHVYTPAEMEERTGKGWVVPEGTTQVAALLKAPEIEKKKPGRPRKVQ
jgi:hypothetical protein